MTTKRLKLAIGLPAYGGVVSAEHCWMFLNIGNIVGSSQERFELVSCGYVDVNPVDRARNRLVAEAMIKEADWLLMIDGDTWVADDGGDCAGFQLLRMISEADKSEAAIVMAPVVRRVADSHKRDLMIYSYADEGSGDLTQVSMRIGKDGIPLNHAAMANPVAGLWPTHAGATAVMAVNLHEINRVNATFKFTEERSEDLEFCRQVREGDGKIFVDTRVRTAHLSRSFPLFNR